MPPNAWASYLPALVFTYREIQTWRADAWSRDLIRTLLRTHTLAFCGYSGADPVMHSTFREVYEEMARTRPHSAPAAERRPGPENAPVFFFDVAGKREFHSLEILRAATEAGGYPSEKLVEHPNHVEFELGGKFPGLDDQFRWLTHRVLRALQTRALETRLRRLVPRFFGHACRDRDFERLHGRFVALCERERTLVGALQNSPPERRRFESVVGWTWHFLPGLLRELALAEFVESRQGAGSSVRARRRAAYYHPASEHPEWAAWAVVVELAVRSLIASLPGKALPGTLAAVAEESPYAAVSFAGGHAPHPAALCIRLAGFDRPGRAPALTGVFRHITWHWEFGEEDVPWPASPRGLCPAPAALWEWAMAKSGPTRVQATHHLGVTA